MKKLFIFVVSLFVCVGALQTRVFADDLQDMYDSLPTSVDPVGDDALYNNGEYPNPFILNYDINVMGKDLPKEYIQADDNYASIVTTGHETLTFGDAKTKPRSDFAISWAEAICEAAENNYYHRAKGNVDLSEMYLAWSAYNKNGVSTTNTGKDVFDIGGNPISTTIALANGIGFVKEEKFPNVDKETLTNEFINQHTSNIKNDYIITSAKWYTLKTQKDILRAKDAIRTSGALAVPIYISDKWLRNKKTLGALVGNSILSKKDIFTTEKLVNDVLGSDTKYEPNYVGLIVGWDDGVDSNSETKIKFNLDLINTFNYSSDSLSNPNDQYKVWLDTLNEPIYWKTFEPCQPENDGCWIVKINVSGQEDYYYYSYEDALLSNSVAVGVSMEQVSNDITTYQHDINTGFNYYDSGKNEVLFYNVFKPQNKEQIDSVGLFTYQNDIQYELNVYATDEELTLEKLNTVQENNFACMKKSGSFANAGYHTIDLKGKPQKPEFYNSLDYAGYQDQNIYVIVKYTAPAGKNVLVPIDGVAGTYDNIKLTSTNKTGISNIVIGNEIKDLVTVANAPARIKLFTHSVSNKITYHLPDGVTMPEDAKDFYKDYDEVDLLKDAIKEGYEFYGWFTNSNLSEDTKITQTPRVVNGDLDLYPAFKQRIVFDYEGTENDTIVYMNNYSKKSIVIPSNTVAAPEANQEINGWKFTTKAGVEKTIKLFDCVYTFEDAKLNGEDIVCTPIWETIKPKSTPATVQTVLDTLSATTKEVKYVTADSASTSYIKIESEKLIDAAEDKLSKTAVLWFETEIKGKDSDEFKGYKDVFENKLEKQTVLSVIDINVFAQEKGETEGEKIPELSKEIEIDYDISDNAELMEAAQKGILHASQMHNGEIIDLGVVTYDATTKKIKFKTKQFSIFTFTKGESTPATNPSGETNPSGADTTKSTDNKQEDTNNNNSNTNNVNQNADNSKTTDPNFKTPNTGIY